MIYVVGQDGVFGIGFHAAFSPFERQVLPRANGEQGLADPVLGVAFAAVVLDGAFDGELGVEHFVDALFADLCEPQLERLGLGRGDGPDEAQDLLGGAGVGAVELLSSADCVFSWLHSATNRLPSSSRRCLSALR